MIKVSALEFENNFRVYETVALTEAVTVTRDGDERTVMISAGEYHRLKRLDRAVLGLDDFTPADPRAIPRSEPSPESGRYDHELTWRRAHH